jgi:poly(beta-D-mannuronate) lyase
MRRHVHYYALFLLLVVANAACHAQKLRSPWDGTKIKTTNAGHICADMPAFSETLDVDDYYIDDHHSVIDPAKKAAYDKGVEPVTQFGQGVTLAADAYITKGSPAGPICAYALLTAAAKAKAWTGKMPHNQGVYVQHWLLSGAAMAYLKVRNSRTGKLDPAKAEEDKLIQEWLAALASRVREYFDQHRSESAGDGLNNHLYWAGLGVAAEGIATDNRNAFQWGMDTYRTGIQQIQPDGTLPLEMARAGMALHYHLYAAGPLVLLAELGEANKIDLYAENNGAIHKLVKLASDGITNPRFFEQKTGVRQTIPIQISATEIGWAVPYVHRFPDGTISSLIQRAQTIRLWQWGGLPPE